LVSAPYDRCYVRTLLLILLLAAAGYVLLGAYM
jgi:hypothetical protein